MCELAEQNRKICAITAAMALGTGLKDFSQKFSDRFYDVGIAEEHAVTFASGLAKGGMIPVVALYSTFLQRAYDQIVHDVTRTNQHVVFCIDRAGIVEADGDTHQGIFDISYLLPLPNMTILAPSTVQNAVKCLEYAMNYEGPIAIRYPKYLPDGHDNFEPNKWIIEKEIKDVNVLTYGLDVEPIKELFVDKEVGLINKELDGVKVLGNGELTKKLTVKANKFSASAVEKIEAIGGKAEVI